VAAIHPIGKLSLIDLAGSERATTNTGIRLRESTKINCSLLALSNCINALCTQATFIPFRLSKLTRLLKDSLGGNCRTVCLSCVSPSYACYEDTYSALQYANKTKNIRTNITRNTLDVNARIAEYPRIIAELRAQIQMLQSGGIAPGAAEFEVAIEEPFNHEKSSVQMIVARAKEELKVTDLSEQISVLGQISTADIKRRLNQKVAIFAAECNKRRPLTGNINIDNAQRARTLELDSLCLRAQIEVQERQLQMHRHVIRQLMNERLAENVSPCRPVSDKETSKTIPIPSPRSPRVRPDTEMQSTPEEVLIVRQRFQSMQKVQPEHREIDSGPSILVLSAQTTKPPMKLLFNQLIQRVNAVHAQIWPTQPQAAAASNVSKPGFKLLQ
jgi:hypothetical protein